MTPKMISDLAMQIYVIVHFGLPNDQVEEPSDAMALKIIRRRWVDKATRNKDVYHVHAFLESRVPSMSRVRRIQLVRACHTELTRSNWIITASLNKDNMPASLRPFLT